MKIAIIGTVGVPGRYGGFETLAQNLVQCHKNTKQTFKLTVWCSGKDNPEKLASFESADLRYVNLSANGMQSIPYDILSIYQAVRNGYDCILLLGVSGALAIPLIRLISGVRIITNIDGIEWKRDKCKGLASLFLRVSEWAAVRFSHEVIADNQAIADYASEIYGSDCKVIAYGGDHALDHVDQTDIPANLPANYALALCRIEPENNVHVILKAYNDLNANIVFVGNWDNSTYGRNLKVKYGNCSNLYLLDPVYECNMLYSLRANASIYIHGHLAGGTNPSLVEMMHFGIPIFANGCSFNRYTTEGKALYFMSESELVVLQRHLNPDLAISIGADMREIAQRRYKWDDIGNAYFELLVSDNH